MEEFEKLNTYERYIENAKARQANAVKVHPREIAQIMAAELQTENQKGGMQKTADLTAIAKIVQTIEKEPAYMEMMKDPKTLELVKQGNTKELRNSLMAYMVKLKKAEKEKGEPERKAEIKKSLF